MTTGSFHDRVSPQETIVEREKSGQAPREKPMLSFVPSTVDSALITSSEKRRFSRRYRNASFMKGQIFPFDSIFQESLVFLDVHPRATFPARPPQAARHQLKVSDALLAHSSVKRLVLPTTLRRLDAPFFEGCTTLEELRIGTATELGKAALAACEKGSVRIATR